MNKQQKTQSVGEDKTNILSDALWTFAVWVTVWVRQIRRLKNRTNKRENRRKSHDFHRFLELVAGLEPATC